MIIANIVNRMGLEVVFENKKQYENRELFNLTRP